ncbi:MAG TPA: hypothetical protein VFS19_04880 [Planctomycetota bacterium]|nr:hypothetical protein [Planctomycetota bacterium]
MTLAVALLAALVPQDEGRLKESWPKLVEAWKAVEAYKQPGEGAGMLDDELLKLAAKLHGAFDAAGLYAAEGEYLPQAVKAFMKMRARSVFPAGGHSFNGRVAFARAIRIAGAPGGGFEAVPTVDTNPLGSLLNSLKKLQALKQGGLDDEDNVQDELATARKSMKAIGITADDTPAGLRRRALHLLKALSLGEDYPASAPAPEEQANRIKGWIADLGHESIETREAALKELKGAGEAALPFAREALKSPDAEVATRARSLLGYGHAPWKNVKPQESDVWSIDVPIMVPAPVAPAPPPKPEAPK